MIEEEFSERTASASDSLVPAQLVEQLAERETRRLAKALHTRLKRKEYAEKVYLERLQKQEALRAKLEVLEEHVVRADRLKESRSKELQTITEARFQVRDQVRSIHDERFQSRLTDLKAKQIQQEQSLEKFLQEKEEKQSVAAEVWEAKLHAITQRAREQQSQLKRKKDQVLQKQRDKSVEVAKRRAKHIRINQLRGEEVNLRLLDAIEKRQQMERMDAEKRNQIATLLQEDIERAHLIELTKEQLLEQRKQLAIKQKEMVPVQMEPDPSPGPTDYEANVPPITEAIGGYVSQTKPRLDVPGTIDFETAKAGSIPGPGHYSTDRLNGGVLPWQEFPTLAWSSSKKVSYAEQEGKAKQDIPGPASYDVPESPRDKSAAVFKRDIVPPSHLRKGTDLPGPGTYTVDAFTRMEQIYKKFDKNKRLITLPPMVEPPGIDDSIILEI